MAAILAACSPPTPVEELVVAKIRAMESAIESGERLNFMSHVAEEFRGQGGAMNHDQLRAFIVLQLRRYQSLEARLMPITVQEIGETEARAEFRALLTGGGDWFPEDGRLYSIVTFWRLEDGEWLLSAADWEPATL